ncbi:MAG: DUF460 domain-containing protein, partial [Candidatus Altiarchaeota archaeon]|nr:DUF460 domain-containing protein [Candidatus Altiarchaeota archaeon]
MSEYLIVGVDPGTTTAVAVLDFRGGVVGLHSSKDLGLSGVIEYVMGLGRPSVVACDVASPPDFVSKVASNLGAVLYSPDESLTVSEKLDITRNFDVSDAHQRDALAAALNAYSVYRNKFEKVDSLGFGDEVKHLVVRGVPIGKASKQPEIVEEEKPVKEAAVERPQTEEEKRIRALEKRVSALSEVVSLKEGEVKALQLENARISRESHTGLRRDREFSSMENTIRSLRNKIQVLEGRLHEVVELKAFIHDLTSGKVLLAGMFPKVTNGFTILKNVVDRKELERASGIKAFFTDDPKNRRILDEAGFTVSDPKLLKK